MSLDMELIKQKKKRKETASFHIGQEIINKICVYHLSFWGKYKLSKIQKPLCLLKPKHSVLASLYQNSNTRTILSLHAPLATPCCWKIFSTDLPLSYFWDTSLYITKGVSLARITNDFAWNQKLASSCSEWQKTRLYPPWVWDFAKAHSCQSAHYSVMKRSSIETQVLFCYLTAKSGMSLNNIEIASANTYKNEIKSESFY